jgi:hypothetical protein
MVKVPSRTQSKGINTMMKQELILLLSNVPDDGRVDVSGDDIGVIAFSTAANTVALSAGGRPDEGIDPPVGRICR